VVRLERRVVSLPVVVTRVSLGRIIRVLLFVVVGFGETGIVFRRRVIRGLCWIDLAHVCYKEAMPKIVDHEQRRRELAEAVWRVIRRHGVDGASVRTVAQEAGWSAGALRHYFGTQSELLGFAIELAAERIRERVDALELADDPRRAVEQLLSELLPLDDERRSEAEVWLAFTARSLIDPQLQVRHAEIDDELRAACVRAVEMLGLPPGRRRGLEAERLHALLDGLALHGAMRPERLPPRRIAAVLRRHLDALEGWALRPQ
jgi:AcrR family transcriptional regulator